MILKSNSIKRIFYPEISKGSRSIDRSIVAGARTKGGESYVRLSAIIIHQRESCGGRLPRGVAWESRAPHMQSGFSFEISRLLGRCKDGGSLGCRWNRCYPLTFLACNSRRVL